MFYRRQREMQGGQDTACPVSTCRLYSLPPAKASARVAFGVIQTKSPVPSLFATIWYAEDRAADRLVPPFRRFDESPLDLFQAGEPYEL